MYGIPDHSNESPTSSRPFYVIGKGWYFAAREGLQGPYFLKAQAELRLESLLRIGPPRTELWTECERAARRLSHLSPSFPPAIRE